MTLKHKTKLGIKYTGIDLDCDIAINRISEATRQLKLF